MYQSPLSGVTLDSPGAHQRHTGTHDRLAPPEDDDFKARDRNASPRRSEK
jgi:hypothetical protein